MPEIDTGADGAESLAKVEHSSPAKAKRVIQRHFNSVTGEWENVSDLTPLPVEATLDTTGLATEAKQDEIIENQTDGTQVANPSTYTTRIDEASATVTYIGDAAIGSATSASVWRIKKIDSSSGTSITFADGNGSFDNVFDDRASLTYS